MGTFRATMLVVIKDRSWFSRDDRILNKQNLRILYTLTPSYAISNEFPLSVHISLLKRTEFCIERRIVQKELSV